MTTRCLIPALLLLSGLPVGASAQFHVEFSGGNGNPFSVTLLDPITFTIDSNTSLGGELYLEIVGTGDFTSGGGYGGTGDLGYSVNGGTSVNYNYGQTGVSVANLTANDMYFAIPGSVDSLAANDTVVISAGTFTSTNSIVGAVPTSGSYDVQLISGSAQYIAATGTQVPEPSTYAAFAGLLSLATVLGLRRSRR